MVIATAPGEFDNASERRDDHKAEIEATRPTVRKSIQASLRCLHCGRNQSRHLRNGRGNWSCRACGKLNPGPALLAALLSSQIDLSPRRRPRDT